MREEFKNRREAGRILARLLKAYQGGEAIVYALPRGGVEVGVEVAEALKLPMDLIITRKISHPYNSEFAIGAVAEKGQAIYDEESMKSVEPEWYKEEAERQRKEARRRRELYAGGSAPIACSGKTAILVDDGVATGLTMKAAVREVKLNNVPKKIIIAIPVTSKEVADELEEGGAEVVAIITDRDFLGSVGAYYQDFSQVSDEQVIRMMKDLNKRLVKKEKAELVRFAEA